jgi:hypothetical protein
MRVPSLVPIAHLEIAPSRDSEVPGNALEREPTSMKRNLKTRLTLNRETLRTLDGGELQAAPGGSAPQLCLITATCYNCPTVTCYTRCNPACTTSTC